LIALIFNAHQTSTLKLALRVFRAIAETHVNDTACFMDLCAGGRKAVPRNKSVFRSSPTWWY
jgi:hypothetical protein